MIPRSKRLPHAVFTGRPLRRAGFRYGSIAFFTNMPPQGAVVVSKKVAKTAPVRNRIRRRVYHALRALLPNSGHSVVIYPTKDVAKIPFKDLTEALAEAFNAR